MPPVPGTLFASILNPLIKVMNLVSLLVLPAILTLRNNNMRYVISGVALLVVVGALFWSKRMGGGMADDLGEAEAHMTEDTAQASAVMHGDREAIIRQALEIWMDDLPHDEADLRSRIAEVHATLPAGESST